MAQLRSFRSELNGETVIFSVIASSIGIFDEERSRGEWDAMLEVMDESRSKNVILDMDGLDYFGSVMLYLMVRLWKHANQGDGKFILCGLSSVGLEIVKTAKFDTMWPVLENRALALESLED